MTTDGVHTPEPTHPGRPDPTPLRHALVGGAGGGVVGAVVGLVIGLQAYPPTAWFAVLEVGVPAALVGGVVGLVVGAVRQARVVRD